LTLRRVLTRNPARVGGVFVSIGVEIRARLALPERATVLRVRADVFMSWLRASYFVNIVFAVAGVAAARMWRS